MADNTLIEWARHPVTGKGATWNIVTGCSVVSPGCINCYAMKLAGTRLRNHPSREGLTFDSKSGPVWNGRVRFNEQWLTQPLTWKTPRGIFVAAHGDLFAEGVTDDQLDRIFALMALAHQHVFFVLTKRPERMRDYLTDRHGGRLEFRLSRHMLDLPMPPDPAWPRLPLPNVWLGVSVEDQPRADERIHVLLDTPAVRRFISAEPLLGPVDLTRVHRKPSTYDRHMPGIACISEFLLNALDGSHGIASRHRGEYWSTGYLGIGVDWVIAGGESGSNARPMHPDWARTLRDQCAAAGVPFFFKQWGSWGLAEPGRIGEHEAHALADDGTLYKLTDLAHPDGPRRLAALEAGHDKAHLTTVYHTGKKAAGRELDGKLHDAMPEIRP